ncbi:MAG: hypothetical protein LBT05_08420 [Planctomycetaceae bacterium]|jgi:hypothetical protein|nr:hypothetical protein [Planctomycetaceae bacterium]
MISRTFTDTKNRTWTPEINLFTAARLKRNINVDIDNPENLSAAFIDLQTLADFLFISVEDQAVKAGVSSEDFGRSLSGDVLERAKDALVIAVSDFFGETPKRTAFMEMLTALKEETSKNLNYVFPKIKNYISKMGETYRKEFDLELENQTQKIAKKKEAKKKISGKTFGDTPESLESIPSEND